MVEISHTRIHDIITQAKKAEPLSEEEYRYMVPSREEVLGMRYKRGETIIDKVTGKEGEVIGGVRAAVTKG